MAGINKVILVGNLGANPEVRTLENGTKVAQFNLATGESYKDKDGNWQEQTEWHKIILWRLLAERAENQLKKGSKIYFEGKLRSRSWTNKENVTQYITEIVGDKFLLLDKREPSSEGTNYEANNASKQVSTTNEPSISRVEEGDDLPF